MGVFIEVNTGLTPDLESPFFFFSEVNSKDKPVAEELTIFNILQSLTLEKLKSFKKICLINKVGINFHSMLCEATVLETAY